MFAKEDEGFQEMCDRLLAKGSTKQSIQMSENKKATKQDNPVDVDALSNGKSKGKAKKGSSGKGRQQKPEQHEQCLVLVLWQVWPLGERLYTKVVVKRQRLVRNRFARLRTCLMDGLGVVSMLMGCGNVRLSDRNWFRMVDNSKRLVDTLGNQKNPVGGFEINSTERCWSKNPRVGG